MTAELGARIRAARMSKGMSLRATAAAASISPSLLSQVETGKVQPSVSTLYSIVNTLGLRVDDILMGPSTKTRTPPDRLAEPVQRFEDAPRLVMENGVTWRALAATQREGGVDALHVHYEPGGASSIDGTHMRHSGVEYGYIIRGELTLKIGFDTHVLRAGDSVCFDPQRPHRYINHTDDITEGVWFVMGSPRTEGEVSEDVEIRTAVDVIDVFGRMAASEETS